MKRNYSSDKIIWQLTNIAIVLKKDLMAKQQNRGRSLNLFIVPFQKKNLYGELRNKVKGHLEAAWLSTLRKATLQETVLRSIPKGDILWEATLLSS